MYFSIITVTKNSAQTIERTLRSVLAQKNVSVEHIIKDAISDDDTLKIVRSVNSSAIVISKPDNGIYDAMNQGYLESSGEVLAFLNSDDFYIDENVLADVSQAFSKHGCDFVYGNIDVTSNSGEVFRRWRTGDIGKAGLRGKQIPHPSIFIKRNILEKLSIPFDSSYRISADLKQQLLIVNKLSCKGYYIDRSLAVMAIGGESTKSFSAYISGWKESVRAYNEVMKKGGTLYLIKKVVSKIKGIRPMALF